MGLPSCLWHDGHRTELPKILSKGKCGLHGEPLHDHPADAISKTPALILVPLENRSGLLHIVWHDPHQPGNCSGKEARPQPQRRWYSSRILRSVNSSSIT
jgi:hypothetical protein